MNINGQRPQNSHKGGGPIISVNLNPDQSVIIACEFTVEPQGPAPSAHSMVGRSQRFPAGSSWKQERTQPIKTEGPQRRSARILAAGLERSQISKACFRRTPTICELCNDSRIVFSLGQNLALSHVTCHILPQQGHKANATAVCAWKLWFRHVTAAF